ncbi:MAG: pyruvate formate-lyase 1-activating enzyme [Tenericutes bacterium HGW-Tenericutes-3]|nr:MAG: pyruvate formate-lyase 1-activating enzyme [Tenericutes bacterium HGW-Tenericutes-3]
MKASNERYANVHSIETLGAFDGPGIRYVLFLQGCPFQCQYCHNRDTWSTKQNQLMTSSQILDDYQKYSHFYKKGGITVSGGEPLLQTPFLIELFQKAKAKGIHTCLDTSAACFTPKHQEAFKELMKYTDLVLLDIKHIDDQKHKKLTGSSNKQVLEFARYLDELKVKVAIRHVLVPTISDDLNDLKKLRSFLDTLTNVISIEVLPYHTKGISKWKELGFEYQLLSISEPTEESIENAEEILKRGYPFYK